MPTKFALCDWAMWVVYFDILSEHETWISF